MSSASEVINVLLAEEGYLEKRSNSQLDSKTANAGSGNYTKYWRDVYPAYQGQYWCDCLVKWGFIKAFGVSEAKKLLCHGSNGWSFYTPTSAQYFKNAGRWHTTPQAGDQVFFRNSSRICHTGIVVRVSGNTVYTIEGNTTSASGVVANGGCVRQKSYTIGTSYIAGYGRPAYSSTGTSGGSSSGSGGKSSYNMTVQWTGKVTADVLNVRKGPGTNYDRLVSYPSITNGTNVGVCDSTNASNGKKWYYVKISGSKGEKYGFVSSDYIKKVEGSSSSTTYYTVTASLLNMRKSAGNGQIIISLKNGTKVEYLNKDTTVSGTRWLYVKSGSNQGWCSSKYLKKI